MKIVKARIRKEESLSSQETIEQVKSKYEIQLLNIEGVEGVGIGKEQERPVIKVYIVKKTKDLEKKIPKEIEGYRVIIEVSGEFRAF